MDITRRDFLGGLAFAGAATQCAHAAMTGQTDAVNATAHAWRDHPERFRNAVVEVDDGIEDLVVVGAGISGLTGAYLYNRHAGRPIRMLVLDAMGDIGGHAQRNEFVSRSGRRLIGYGGSQALDTPSFFSPAVRSLLAELDIDLTRFETEFYDPGWTQRHGLSKRGVFFDAAAWGAELSVIVDRDVEPADWSSPSPFTPQALADMHRLRQGRAHPWRGVAASVVRTRLAGMSYRDYLLDVCRVDKSVALYHEGATRSYFGVGIDATSALDASVLGALPGFEGLDLGDSVDRRMSPSGRLLKAGKDRYIYHFPDGNHAVARALLRALRPSLVPGTGMETLSDADVDAASLDDPAAAIRVRLRSTVIGVRHLGPPSSAESVEVRYVDPVGRQRVVRARQVLLASWHRGMARMCDEWTPMQARALDDQVKVPLVYATALLSNWHAWQRAGIASIESPGGFWDGVALDMPISIGRQRFPQSPDEPILLHLDKVVVPGGGADPRTQSKLGRAQLLAWPFSRFEQETRRTLEATLGAHGFDWARDMEALTVNRWGHGYTYEYMRPWDRHWPDGTLPVVAARRAVGRIAIAGSDSGAYAYAHSAIDQAFRAVQELLPQARLPTWSRFPGPDLPIIGL